MALVDGHKSPALPREFTWRYRRGLLAARRHRRLPGGKVLPTKYRHRSTAAEGQGGPESVMASPNGHISPLLAVVDITDGFPWIGADQRSRSKSFAFAGRPRPKD